MEGKTLPGAETIITKGFVCEPNESTIVPLHTVGCPEDKENRLSKKHKKEGDKYMSTWRGRF
jgi:hypothetical protein